MKKSKKLPAIKNNRPSINYTKDMRKNDDINALNVLNYQNYQTLKVHDLNKKIYIETDENFIRDVRNILKVRQNSIFGILNIEKSQLTDKDCDQLDYRARIHFRANIVNQNTKRSLQDIDKQDRCFCGCNRAQGPWIPICTNQQKLNVFGPGILLLFLFLKSVSLALLSVVFIYSIFGVATNLLGNSANTTTQCQVDKYCQFKRSISDQNKMINMNFHQIQLWLGLAFCVVWIFALRIIKFVGKQKNRIVDQKLKSASDYAILIKNLPRGSYQEKQLIAYFQTFWQRNLKQLQQNKNREMIFTDNNRGNNFKIKSIQIIYNMQFSRLINQQIFKLAVEVDSHLVANPSKQSDKRNVVIEVEKYRIAKMKLKQTYELLIDLRKKFLYDSQFRKDLSTTCCILQFKSQNMRKLMLKNFGSQKVGIIKKIQILIRNFFSQRNQDVIFKGNVISIQRAPQPSDIMWTNCQKSYSLGRIVAIYGVTFLIILASFSLILGLGYLQDYAKKDPVASKNNQIITVINLAISVVILCVNKFLWFALFYLLDLQYNYTLTDKTISQMNKVLLLTSINTIVLPILTNYIIVRKNFIYGNTGISGLVFDFHVSCIVQVFAKLFNPVTIGRFIAVNIKFIRYKIIRFLCMNPSKVNFKTGSPQVNKFYEGEDFSVAQNYVHIIGTILHAVFFCQLQPVIIILVAVMSTFFYYVNRIRLIRIVKIPEMTEYLVFDTAIWMLGLVPLYYGAGSLAYAYLAQADKPDYSFSIISPLICIGIGIFALMNPCNLLNIITQFFISKCKCIDISEMMGEYDDDDVQSVSQKQDESVQNLDAEKNNQQKQIKIGYNRIQSYYQGSNSLTLLGFEKIFRGENEKSIMNQLKMFCQSFFPKTDTKNQNIVINILKNQFKFKDDGDAYAGILHLQSFCPEQQQK